MAENRRRSYSQKTIKILYASSGARCSKCGKSLIIEGVNGEKEQFGEIAHIYPSAKIEFSDMMSNKRIISDKN